MEDIKTRRLKRIIEHIAVILSGDDNDRAKFKRLPSPEHDKRAIARIAKLLKGDAELSSDLVRIMRAMKITEENHMETKYLYLVLSFEFGLSAFTTVHASEAGAEQLAAAFGGMFVSRKVWDGDVRVGMKVRLGGVSTAYDDDFTSPTVRDESADASWGRIVEVLP